MNNNKITYSVRALAVISFIAICIKYFRPNEISFYILLTPYLIIYLLSKDDHDFKSACIRACSAILSVIFVPYLVFGIELDIHAGMGILLIFISQLTAITSSELIILFLLNKGSENTTKC